MKLEKFDIVSLNENNRFIDEKQEFSEEEQKLDIIKKLSDNWNEKLKTDFLAPKALYSYSLDELKEIEKYYLNENDEYCDFGCNYISKFVEKYPEYDNEDFFEYVSIHNKANKDINELEDISKEEIERLANEWKLKYSEKNEYKEIETNICDDEKCICHEYKNCDPKLIETFHELKQKYLTNEAVEDIRIEDDEIVFDVKCETEVQSIPEYNGFKLKFNYLCSIDEYNEKLEEEIIEHAKMIKEQVINQYIEKLFESPDNITIIDTNNKNLVYIHYDDKNVAKPFAFTIKNKKKPRTKLKPEELGQLWIGDWSESHTQNCPFLKCNNGDYSYNELLLGRLWFRTSENSETYDIKILSTWNSFINNIELLQYIVSEIEKAGYNLSEWSYDTGNYKYIIINKDEFKITQTIPLKELGITFLDDSQKFGANLYVKNYKKSTPLMYRQAIYGENKVYNFEEYFKMKNKKI